LAAALGAEALGADLAELYEGALPPTLPPYLSANAVSALNNITEQMAAITRDYFPKLVKLKPCYFSG